MEEKPYKKKNFPHPAPKGNKYALGNPGQCPSVFTQEWLANEAKLFLEWMERPDSLYIKSFAIERGYSPSRLAEFADKSTEFQAVYNQAKDWQEQKIVNMTWHNKINFGMTKLFLSKHHDYHEKTEVATQHQIQDPITLLFKNIDGSTKDIINDK